MIKSALQNSTLPPSDCPLRLFPEAFPEYLIYICNPLLPLLLFIAYSHLTYYISYLFALSHPTKNKTVAKHLFIQYSANTLRYLEL